MSHLWLIRHGQAGDVLGDYDKLSERGQRQARLAGQTWPHLRSIGAVRTGSMRRHRESAAGFAAGFSGALPEAVEDAGFDEFDHMAVIHAASAAGIAKPESGGAGVFFRYFAAAMARWASGQADADYPESYAAFEARVCAALDRAVAATERERDTLVFTSGGVISTVARRLLELSPSKAFEINSVLANMGVTGLRVSAGGRARLVTLNVTTHFAAEPELFTLV